MDKWVPIIQKVQKNIVRIVLFSEGEIISEGTGTIINSIGLVITAAHVIEPFQDYVEHKKECTLYVFSVSQKLQYRIATTPFIASIPIKKNTLDVKIDIAILEPVIPVIFQTYLKPEINVIDIPMGSDLLMCGYSEETLNFYDIEDIIKKFHEGVLSENFKDELRLMEGSMRPPTYKSGILAHTTYFISKSPKLRMQFLHIDNGVHCGMSGGPVINSKGQFIGIVTTRNTIEATVMAERTLLKFEVPSGNSIGITLNYLSIIDSAVKAINLE